MIIGTGFETAGGGGVTPLMVAWDPPQKTGLSGGIPKKILAGTPLKVSPLILAPPLCVVGATAQKTSLVVLSLCM